MFKTVVRKETRRLKIHANDEREEKSRFWKCRTGEGKKSKPSWSTPSNQL
jgi:hypothetical protein